MDSIREATGQQEQLKAEQIGYTQLKKQQKFLNVDDIDDLKQGMNEQIDNANEISNALSREIGDPTPDDDELENYFQSLQAKKPRQINPIYPNLPQVPTNPLPSTSNYKNTNRNRNSGAAW